MRRSKKALILRDIIETIPLYLTDSQIFAGSQDDAFARSYALINPTFKVEEFSGYCDPTAVFGDIEPNDEFTAERISRCKGKSSPRPSTPTKLREVYVRGRALHQRGHSSSLNRSRDHLIPDVRFAIKHGVRAMIDSIKDKSGNGYKAFAIALECAVILANRYADMAAEQKKTASPERREQLEIMERTLRKVPEHGADDLYEAIQSFMIIWQIMCLEQTPNPFAFSVGNADRIFEPYRNGLDRDTTAALLKHFLVFFNVADRSWAISQNIIISGRDIDGNDLTNPTTYALMDAYFDMNLPQPILSVKLHKNTPAKLYEEMGRFLFSPGVLTPSFFNDDSLYAVLSAHGVAAEDLPDISIAGCQEPLVMGKDNGNTTNSWLNLPKILEMTLTGGVSTVTGEKLVDIESCSLENIREGFYKNVQRFVDEMAKAANGASRAISTQRVPFLSCLMGGLENGIDARDIHKQGTKYNGSGCLIHGVSVIADSFAAIDKLLAERPQDSDKLVDALKANFKGYEELREFLLSADKFGNNIEKVDSEAAEIASKVADIVAGEKKLPRQPVQTRLQLAFDPSALRLLGRRNSRRQKLQRYARLRRGSALRQR